MPPFLGTWLHEVRGTPSAPLSLYLATRVRGGCHLSLFFTSWSKDVRGGRHWPFFLTTWLQDGKRGRHLPCSLLKPGYRRSEENTIHLPLSLSLPCYKR